MPANTPPKLKTFARQLLASEAALGNPAGAKDPETFRACAKLRAPLVKLIGVGGFRSLASRALALALASEEAPFLRALQIKVDGSFAGLETEEVDPRDPRNPAEAAAAEVEFMAKIVGLLVTFIGPALTLQVLRDVWPKLNDPNFGAGETL